MNRSLTTCSMSAVAFIGLAIAASPAAAQVPRADKSGYTLLNPTPRELWRPLSADRPDLTESPYTVDAGAVQLELSFVDYLENGDERQWTAAPTTLKLGLLNDVDVQLVVQPYVHLDDGERTHDGLGDTQVRLKINLYGNDHGDWALAFMPFVQLPTAASGLGSDYVEGGVILPFATDLTAGLGLGLMLEADFVYDELDNGYDTEVLATALLGMDITESCGAYVEGIGILSTEASADFQSLLGIGATYALTENLILDAGANIGLAGDADDLNLFAGMTLRF